VEMNLVQLLKNVSWEILQFDYWSLDQGSGLKMEC